MSRQHYRVESYKPRESIGYLMKRAHALMHDNLDPALAEHGFTFMQWVVLIRLREGLPLNPKDICGEVRHDSGALTRVIDQLARRGLLERQRDLKDRRKVDLHLTTAGRKAVEALIPVVVDIQNLALADFSRAEATEFTRLLTKLNEAMQARLEQPATVPEAP